MTTTVDRPSSPPVPRVRRLANPMVAPIAVGCCLAGSAAYVAAVDPSESGGFLPCPFRSLTGLWCPGCGLTRATHQLLRGDLIQALRFNVFVLVMLVGIAASWWTWMRRAALGTPDARRLAFPAWVISLAIVIVVGYAVVRNLPGAETLRGGITG